MEGYQVITFRNTRNQHCPKPSRLGHAIYCAYPYGNITNLLVLFYWQLVARQIISDVGYTGICTQNTRGNSTCTQDGVHKSSFNSSE